MDFINSLNSFIKTKRFADSVDYFNNRFIPGFILSCSFLMTYKQYVMKPISCYTPNHPLGRGFDEYIQNQCYLSEEYAIHNVNQEIHWKSIKSEMLISNKYMWFPIILILQAISCCISNGFWLYFGKQTDCNYIIEMCYKASLEADNRASIRKIACRLQKYFGKRKINFKIASVYMITKLITIGICCINLSFY